MIKLHEKSPDVQMINGVTDQHMSRENNIPKASAFPIFLDLLRQFDSV